LEVSIPREEVWKSIDYILFGPVAVFFEDGA
jgi:hypothetical protein